MSLALATQEPDADMGALAPVGSSCLTDREPRPFLVYALGRCRSAWLSKFLTFGGWRCHHEMAVYMRSVHDVRAFLRHPCTGTVETAAAPAWPLIQHHFPNLRQVVVRRPIDEVVASMMAVDVGGEFTYDEAVLRRGVDRLARDLDRIACQPGVLTVEYADLDHEDACRAVFEHCLPFNMPPSWWGLMRDRHVECDVRGILTYYHANRAAIDAFKSACKAEMRSLARAGGLRTVTV